MGILSRSAVGVLPRMGTLLLAALTLATYRGDPQMFNRLPPFWHSRSVHSRLVIPNSFVNRSRYKTSYYELQYFRLSERHAAGRVGHELGGKGAARRPGRSTLL